MKLKIVMIKQIKQTKFQKISKIVKKEKICKNPILKIIYLPKLEN